MTEAEVTKQVLEFLTERGWRCLRMQSGLFKSTSGYGGRVRVGEKGMADWLCVSYMEPIWVLWLEVKAPGKELRPAQKDWIQAELMKGATVCVADSLETFKSWYAGVFG